MTTSDRDPEQLLAEALRAQAAQAPVTPDPAAPAAEPAPDTAEDEATGPETPEPSEPGRSEPEPEATTGDTPAGDATADEPGTGEPTEPAPNAAPPAAPIAPAEGSVGYGLLSGADASTVAQVSAELNAQHAATAPPPPAPEQTASPGITRTRSELREPVRPQLRAGWVLLLAVLLGLAAGAVVGLATLV